MEDTIAAIATAAGISAINIIKISGSKSIEIVKKTSSSRMCVGAGTTVTIEQARAAAGAGADFILAPDTNPAVIAEVKKLGMISIPGAMTPTEIQTAWNSGADIVKIFPASFLGIDYIKAIRGPISNVPLMAVGGVDENNVKSFLDSGCCSCGIGSNIMKPSLINEDRFDQLTELAKLFVKAAM